MSDFLNAGRLEDHPFAELCGLIFQESRTGELVLESGNRRRSVWFLGGNPVAVVSNDPQDHLAQFLLEHGKIGAEDARRLADLPETREALVGADFLPKETLNWGVKSRFVSLCYDLFRWEEGDYGFRDGEPPREQFLLKVPAHSLIFKGVGLLGQAAVFDAVPDDAVCGAGPVSSADARYLNPEARQLLEQCRPGNTVADALGGGSTDPDQARRLLYALASLGLVAIARGGAAAPPASPQLEDAPGFSLDDDVADELPAAFPDEDATAGFALDDRSASGESPLDLPPLDTDFGSPFNPTAEFAPGAGLHAADNLPFEEESGSESFGAFGTFTPDTALDQQNVQPLPDETRKVVAGANIKRSARRFHLPRLVGIALGGIAAVGIIGFAGWWWMNESEPPPPPVQPPIKRPAPPKPAPAAGTPAVAPSTQPTLPTPAPTPTAAPSAAPASPAAATPPAPAPAVVAPTRPTEPPPPRSASDRYRNALEIFRAGDLDGAAAIWEALLAEEHRGAFTVQVLTACQPDTVREAQRSLPGHEFYLVTKKVNARVCYRICLGAFDSRENAGRALAGLPGEYRTGGAAVRPVADVLNRDR